MPSKKCMVMGSHVYNISIKWHEVVMPILAPKPSLSSLESADSSYESDENSMGILHTSITNVPSFVILEWSSAIVMPGAAWPERVTPSGASGVGGAV
jgi:hypothetical protein